MVRWAREVYAPRPAWSITAGQPLVTLASLADRYTREGGCDTPLWHREEAAGLGGEDYPGIVACGACPNIGE